MKERELAKHKSNFQLNKQPDTLFFADNRNTPRDKKGWTLMPKRYFPFFRLAKSLLSSIFYFFSYRHSPFLSMTFLSIQLSPRLMAWRGLLHTMESLRFQPPPSLEAKWTASMCWVLMNVKKDFFVCVLHIMFLTPGGATINCRASFTRSHNRSRMRIWRQIASQSPWVRLLGLMRRRALILNSSSTQPFLH